MAIANENMPKAQASNRKQLVRRNQAGRENRTSSVRQKQESHRPPWYLRPFWLGMAGVLLLFAAFPPLGCWPLAWIAPLFWIRLISQPDLGGKKRAYLAIWLAGMIYWLALFYFIPIPFWGLYFGWFAMSAYLGIYLPLFVALTRVAVHRLRVSVILSAPVVWVGLELARGHLFTGLSMSLLGHTQVKWVRIIQIADLAGAYSISFVVMLTAACLAKMLPWKRQRFSTWPALVAVAVVGLSLLYGTWRLNQEAAPKDAPTARIALIQGSVDTVFDLTREEAIERHEKIFQQYTKLTADALTKHPDTDLVIWPESKFMVGDEIYTNSTELPYDPPDTESAQPHADEVQQLALYVLGNRDEKRNDAHFLAGTHTSHVGPSDFRQQFNSALLISSNGEIEDRYFKMHRVLFGEYVPLGDWLPWLYKFTPMSGEVTAGTRPQVFTVDGLNYAPSICFESTAPHVIRSQFEQLAEEGTPVDFLVNITDDGWFKGSACLDHHLACSIMRAVELRTPMLIAANTGFSGVVDGNGRVLQKGPRRETALLFAEIQPDSRHSVYEEMGDWLPFLCLASCGLLTVVGLLGGRRRGLVAAGKRRS